MTTEQAIAADPKALVFQLNDTPVLSAGRWSEVLAHTPGLTARVVVYAEGGENTTHTHLAEHHLFFILGGEATFQLGRDGEETFVAKALQGVLLPKGSFYRFKSSGNENLVMMRVGDEPGDYRGRFGPDGGPLLGGVDEPGYAKGIPIPGKTFKEL